APHKDFGEAVVAVIVRQNEKLTEEDIQQSLQDRLAKFKQPKAVIFLDELPRNTMGKVQKAALRKSYEKLFASA
ncbi:MAG: AMP-binding enzyme, partial [Candidatus Puniceispirillaceae bacterium]